MISVLMSTYNEPISYIRLAIESILTQSYKNIEFIIVVDNPKYFSLISTLNEYANKDSRIRILINDKNIGLTKSLNRAFNCATGQYIARMDADDISNKERLQRQLNFLEKNHLDLVGSNIQNIDENCNKYSGITVFPETNAKIVKYARYDSPIAHPTWLAKRGVYDSLKGYRDIDACEDYDFLIRAILHGYKMGNLQENLLNYRINSSGISATKKTKQKLALTILRENYRNGKETSKKEYIEYINSEKGRRRLREVDNYYKKTAKLKEMSGNRAKSLFFKISIFIKCKEGRQLVFNLMRERLLLR